MNAQTIFYILAAVSFGLGAVKSLPVGNPPHALISIPIDWLCLGLCFLLIAFKFAT